jgi:hypothetical protein
VLTQIVKPTGSQDNAKVAKATALTTVLCRALGVKSAITDAIGGSDEARPTSGSDEERKKWEARKYVRDFYDWSLKLDDLKGGAQKID